MEEAIAKFHDVDLVKVTILEKPPKITLPAGNSPYRTYSILYGVTLEREEGDVGERSRHYYKQSIALLPDNTWTFQPRAAGNPSPKTPASLSKALQAEILEQKAYVSFSPVSYKEISGITYKKKKGSTRDREIYEVNYKLRGVKQKSIEVVRTRGEGNDWNYAPEAYDPFAELHDSLLKRILTALQSVRQEIDAMETMREKIYDHSPGSFYRTVYAEENVVRREISAQRNEFPSLLLDLEYLKGDSRLSVELRSRITSWVEPDHLKAIGLDDAALDQLTDEFHNAFWNSRVLPAGLDPKERRLGQFEADLQAVKTFAGLLQEYRRKITEAASLTALRALSQQFPVKPGAVFNFVDPQTVDPRPRLAAGIRQAEDFLRQAKDSVSPEDPVEAVNRIASRLYTSFDIDEDGALTGWDLALIDYGRRVYAENPGAFGDSTQKIFSDASIWRNFTDGLKRYLTAGDAAKRLGSLEALWHRRGAYDFNPVLKQSILPFLVPATLEVSLAADRDRWNFALATLVTVLREEGHIETYDARVRDYITRHAQRLRLETDEEFAQRVDQLVTLWTKFRVLVNYSSESFPGHSDDTLQRLLIVNHQKFLHRISSLMEGEAPPYIRRALKMIQFYSGLIGAGAEAQPNGFISLPALPVKEVIHEIAHVEAWDYSWHTPPGFGALWAASSDPEDFVSPYGRTKAVEEWAELVSYYTRDSHKFLKRALDRAAAGKPLLLEKFLVFDQFYPRLPDELVTYEVDEETGAVTKGSLPIQRDTNGRITQITFEGRTYNV